MRALSRQLHVEARWSADGCPKCCQGRSEEPIASWCSGRTSRCLRPSYEMSPEELQAFASRLLLVWYRALMPQDTFTSFRTVSLTSRNAAIYCRSTCFLPLQCPGPIAVTCLYRSELKRVYKRCKGCRQGQRYASREASPRWERHGKDGRAMPATVCGRVELPTPAENSESAGL